MTYPFPAGNAAWSHQDVIALLCQPGYMSPDDWRPITASAVVFAESDGNPHTIGQIIWKPDTPVHLSIDLGLFQLNSYWHTTVDPYPDIRRITIADGSILTWPQAVRPDTIHVREDL